METLSVTRGALAHGTGVVSLEPTCTYIMQREKCNESGPSSTMKRKRSTGSTDSHRRKKVMQQPLGAASALCPLIRVLQQYGLLESIVSCLHPNDLLALVLSAKAIYNAIAPRPGSLHCVLGKLRCPGRGIEIRKKRHRNSTFFYAYDCTEYVQCGTTAPERNVDSRACIKCKITTCDECRIHCVYQSNFENASDKDELPNFSGFVLLNPPEIPILSPHHMDPGNSSLEPQWQDPSKSTSSPYHDQGFIDVPFEDDAYGPIELVADILDLDLGQNSLAVSASSNVPDPSPVLRAFYKTTEQRKRWFCDNCLPAEVLMKRNISEQNVSCRCTLRGRFLDRWQCLRCYEKEEKALLRAYPAHMSECGCRRQSGEQVCTWCWGTIAGLTGDQPVESNPAIDADFPQRTL